MIENINYDSRNLYYSTYFHKFQNENLELSEYYNTKFKETFPANKEAKILEIGTGMGYFISTLKKKGYNNIIGVDVSDELIEIATKQSGVIIEKCNDVAEYLSFYNNEFDRIYMLDVIEHIEKNKVVNLLCCIKKALKNDGNLILTTENMASPISRIQHYLDFTHEYNFCESSLNQVLAIAGFTNIKIWEMKEKMPLRPKYFIQWVKRRIWFKLLKSLYNIERPNSVNPLILGKELIASAAK